MFVNFFLLIGACDSEGQTIVYYVPRHTIWEITRLATILAGDRSQGVAETKPRRIRGAIRPASIVASLVITQSVCIGTYSILCDFGAYTSFYATVESSVMLCIRIQRNLM